MWQCFFSDTGSIGRVTAMILYVKISDIINIQMSCKYNITR